MRRLVVSLVVLLALAVGADRVTALLVGRAVAEQLQASGGLATEPDVTVHGFPFLTQAVRGEYDDVEVDTGLIDQQGVRLALLVHVLGAQVPLSEGVRGTVTVVPVAGLRGTAVLAYSELSPNLTVAPVAGGVSVKGSVTVLGHMVTGIATSDVRLEGTTLVITARSIAVNGGSSPALDAALRQLFDLRVPLGTLPYGLKVSSVQPRADGLHLSARSGPTVLRPVTGALR